MHPTSPKLEFKITLLNMSYINMLGKQCPESMPCVCRNRGGRKGVKEGLEKQLPNRVAILKVNSHGR